MKKKDRIQKHKQRRAAQKSRAEFSQVAVAAPGGLTGSEEPIRYLPPKASGGTRIFKRALAVGAAVLLAGFFGLRIAQFRLRPLDSPGTLHYLLWPWFESFAHHYGGWDPAGAAWQSWGLTLLLIPVVLALLNLYSTGSGFFWRSRVVRAICSGTTFWICTGICLAFCRFPLLLAGSSNVDEAEFTASATKLFVDPLYFRAVDCNTSGPLNIYPLMLPALFGLSPDYASARLLALVLMFASIYILYRAFRLAGKDVLARIAVLPVVGFFCLPHQPDFVHYSSETFPMLLISLAVYACIRIVQRPELWRGPILGLGALISAGFFSKMQSVPIIAAAALVGLAYVIRVQKARWPWRPVLLLSAGGAPLPALVIILCAATGLWRDFWSAYLVGNWGYTRSYRMFFRLFPRLASFVVVDIGELHFFIVALLVILVVSVYKAIQPRQRNKLLLYLEIGAVSAVVTAGSIRWYSTVGTGDHSAGSAAAILIMAAMIGFLIAVDLRRSPPKAALGALSAAMLAGSGIALYTPDNTAPHYLLLFVIPLCTTLGWLLIRQTSNAETSAAAPLKNAVPIRRSRLLLRKPFGLLMLVLIAGSNYSSIKSVGYNFHRALRTTRLPEGELIDSHVPAGSGIVVWGWRPEIYLSAGMVPATRDTIFARFFVSGKAMGEFHFDRFIRDMRRHPAALFVDALDVSCCGLNDRSTQAFELIPAISSYIHSHYVFVGSKYDERFYLRRDLATTGLDFGAH